MVIMIRPLILVRLILCSSTYTVTSTDVTLGFVNNIAQAKGFLDAVNGAVDVFSNTDNVTVYPPPTAVTIGKVELDVDPGQ